MRIITLDIETITLTWQEGVSGWNPDRFPPIPFHLPVVVCWMICDNLHLEEGVYRRDKGSESLMLADLALAISGCDRLVTFNGRGFDMPVLGMRAMACDVDWSFWENYRHRYPNYRKSLKHYDLCDQLSDYGAATRPSLDHVCRTLGFGGKTGLDGSKVAEVWASGDRKSIETYCRQDVFDTWLVYLCYLRSYHGKNVQPAIDTTMVYIEEDSDLTKHYGDGMWL